MSPFAADRHRRALLSALLGPDRRFFSLAVIFSVTASVLTLAVPLSVQVLISSVSNTALLRPVVVLAVLLFALLALYGLMYVVQTQVMDRFGRRFFARLARDAVLRSLYSAVEGGRRINREELANRFFEVVTVQRNVPQLVVTGSSLLLQAVVGIVVVSAYHPVFLIFSGMLVLFTWLTWKLWAREAIDSKIKESKAKFQFAHWLEELARLHPTLQSDRTIAYATQEAEALIADYVAAHRRHFGYKLKQIIGFFVLYALSSAALLGVGGALVIANQLSLGQLVAAELIFSTVFYSLTRLPWLLDLYYELSASLDKLGEFLDLELELLRGDFALPEGAAGLKLIHVQADASGETVSLDLDVPAGHKVLVLGHSDAQREALVALLRSQRRLRTGQAQLGGIALSDLHPHALRDALIVIDEAEPLERPIAEYLALDDASVSHSAMREVLAEIGLLEAIDRLPQGLETVLARGGDPLTPEQMIRLCVAAALLRRPKVLVMTTLADRLSIRCRQLLVDAVRRRPELTYIQLSHRDDLTGFDAILDQSRMRPCSARIAEVSA